MTDLNMKNARSIHERILEARTTTGNGAAAFSGKSRSVPLSRRGRIALMTMAALALCVVSVLIVYRPAKLLEVAAQWSNWISPSAGKPAASASAANDDPFTANAAGLGAKTCATTYGALGKILTAGTQFMVQTEVPAGEADKRGLQGLVGMRFGGQGGGAAGIVFAAPNDANCEGEMVRVVPFAQDCSAAARLLPKDSRPLQALAGVAVYGLATGGHAMLLPAASGCVAISVLRSAR